MVIHFYTEIGLAKSLLSPASAHISRLSLHVFSSKFHCACSPRYSWFVRNVYTGFGRTKLCLSNR